VKKYVLDTNVYIDAIRSTDAADELHGFYSIFLPITYLSSVVLHELLVGASSPAKSREIKQAFASPFERTRRIITPSLDAWAQLRQSSKFSLLLFRQYCDRASGQDDTRFPARCGEQAVGVRHAL
jgi:predicted nucleic acid-binding protein